MATRGRPLSITTISNRLSHEAEAGTRSTKARATLAAAASYLTNARTIDAGSLHDMVVDLQGVLDEGDADEPGIKSLTQIIDSLARHEVALKPVAKLKPRAKPAPKAGPDWMQDNEREQARVRDVSVQAIVQAIVVILGEVKAGEAGEDDFDAIVHLTRTLQRIY